MRLDQLDSARCRFEIGCAFCIEFWGVCSCRILRRRCVPSKRFFLFFLNNCPPLKRGFNVISNHPSLVHSCDIVFWGVCSCHVPRSRFALSKRFLWFLEWFSMLHIAPSKRFFDSKNDICPSMHSSKWFSNWNVEIHELTFLYRNILWD